MNAKSMKTGTGLVSCFLLPLSGCNFSDYKCKSMQAEAKVQLGAMRMTAEMIKAEHDVYPKSMSELKEAGFAPEDGRYDYFYEATGDSYLLKARGKGEMEGDEWKLETDSDIVAVKDKCK